MSLEPLQIVLVEDSLHDREMTLRVLKRHHVTNPVTVLEDGEHAIEYFFGDGVDTPARRRETCVVLLDLKLPRVDGIEVLRRLKADATTRSIPVVVLTSSAEERDRLTSYDIGANSYIVKPIEFEPFAEAISALGFYWCALNTPAEGIRR
ncbi:MAG: response regulator [Thermoanaerobaculia bacterium]